jgi:hypothetical protein
LGGLLVMRILAQSCDATLAPLRSRCYTNRRQEPVYNHTHRDRPLQRELRRMGVRSQRSGDVWRHRRREGLGYGYSYSH